MVLADGVIEGVFLVMTKSRTFCWRPGCRSSSWPHPGSDADAADSDTSLDNSIEKMNGQRTQKDPRGWTKAGGSPHLSLSARFASPHHSGCGGDHLKEVTSKADGSPHLSSPALLWVPDSYCLPSQLLRG